MKLSKLTFTKHANLPQQVRMPFVAVSDNDAASSMDQISLECGQGLTSAVIANCAATGGCLVDYGNQCEVVKPQNGEWADERYSFTAEFEVCPMTKYNKVSVKTIITGYTDNVASVDGKLDPEMRLYVNDIVSYRTHQTRDGEYVTHAIGAILIASGEPEVGGKFEHLLRPVDMFNHIELMDDLLFDDGDIGIDARGTFHTGIKLINPVACVPAGYFASVIVADHTAASNIALQGEDVFGENRNHLAAAMSDYGATGMSSIVSELKRIDYEFSNCGFLTLATLEELNDIDHVADLTEIVVQDVANTVQYEDWTNQRLSAKMAYMTTQVVQKIMFEYGFSTVKFTSSNETGLVDVNIVELTSDWGVAVKPSTKSAIAIKLISELVNPISEYNNRFVTLDVTAGPHGLIDVAISLDGAVAEHYRYASFASGNLSPAISNSSSNISEVASTYIDIRNALDVAIDRNDKL